METEPTMNQTLKIWCNNLFLPSQEEAKRMLCESVDEHCLCLFEPSENGNMGESAVALQECDVVFGTPDADVLMNAENVRWIHLNSAGYTPYDRTDFKQKLQTRGTIMTNSSAVYDEPCAQHLLAMILSLTRNLPFALGNQGDHKAWITHELRSSARLLNEQTALIFGFGTIARRLVDLLAPLRMNLIGVKRNIRGDEPIPIIQEKQINEYLPLADHVINILPDNAGTKSFFNAERLSKFKSGAFFYNIGRGTTVERDILIEFLEQGKIAAAYLDVTEPEPLPKENPLWTTRNCFITPHIAGGSFDEKERQVRHFLENLRRYTNGEELINRIFN
jgi:phosphoglycerate dehydrogenase-like enzyme